MKNTKQILNKLEIEEALDFAKSQLYLISIFGYDNISVLSLKKNLKKYYPQYYKFIYKYNKNFELFLGLLKKTDQKYILAYNKNDALNRDYSLNNDSFLFLKMDYKQLQNSTVGLINCFQFYRIKEFKNINWI